MLKTNLFKACLLIPAIVFCLNLNGFTEKTCPPPYDCPPNISTIPGTVQYPVAWLLEWDPNNPQLINRNSSVAVNVISGVPPYSWSVSGSGFSLATDETQGLSNTLYADDTACVATVTVTDSRGQIVSGDVRCSCGGWVSKGNICGLPGDYDEKEPWLWHVNGVIYTKYQGNKKQTQHTDHFSNAVCGGETPCTDMCKWYDCSDTVGCISCIEPSPDWCGERGFCICNWRLNYYKYECPE
jgi:hypothetical protein